AKAVQNSPSVLPTPAWERPLVAADALAFYLVKLVFPRDLVVAYGRTPDRVLSQPQVYVAWMLPAAVAAMIWLWRPGRRWLGAAALLVLAGLGPTLGLVNFDFQYFSTVADHYLYLPMFGVALGLA